jgi:hypothetical protein
VILQNSDPDGDGSGPADNRIPALLGTQGEPYDPPRMTKQRSACDAFQSRVPKQLLDSVFGGAFLAAALNDLAATRALGRKRSSLFLLGLALALIFIGFMVGTGEAERSWGRRISPQQLSSLGPVR